MGIGVLIAIVPPTQLITSSQNRAAEKTPGKIWWHAA
jgi:hypothetical protein